MKTLLLTDIPPSSNLTAGIVTAQMCRCVPPGELAIFCVQNPHLYPDPYPDLVHIPIRVVAKPNELNHRNIRRIPIGKAGSMMTETYRRVRMIAPLVRQAVAFGKEERATSLWVILQGQTMVRMAISVADGLRVPMRSQVWDPLSWWLSAHGVDGLNARLDLAQFDRVMRRSVSCATASWEMANQYWQKYGTASRAIIASLDQTLARRPEPKLRVPGELAIGMAGQFYASDEWLQLTWALSLAGWQVNGRKVVVRVLGHQRPTAVPEENLHYVGWQSQAEAVTLLSDTCDILYCPYPYGALMADVAKLSFPSKIPTYLAAGRPVLFHGPAYSGAAKYLKSRGAGFICRANEAAAVYDGLMHLVEDELLYRRLAKGAQEAFLADFTLDRMENDVRSFLGYQPEPAI